MAATETTPRKATLQRRTNELNRIGQLSADEVRALTESPDVPVPARTASYTRYQEGTPGTGDQA
jgi:hypothetical protein